MERSRLLFKSVCRYKGWSVVFLTFIVVFTLIIGFRYFEFNIAIKLVYRAQQAWETVVPRKKIQRSKSDFDYDWLRIQKARIDWRAMLKPCSDQLAWGTLKSGWGRVNKTSASRSYVTYMNIRNSGQFSSIFIQTRTASGQNKTIGGDYWRVFFTGPANVAASVFDYENGTYETTALLLEPGNYTVRAYLDYSLCDGLRDPPENWFRIGNKQGKRQPEGILGFLNDFIYEPLSGGEIITFEVSSNETRGVKNGLPSLTCAQSCRSLWNGFGRWKNNAWLPYLPVSHLPTLEKPPPPRGTLWIFGDSLGVRFHFSLSTKPLCRRIFEQCRHSYNWLYPFPGENEVLSKSKYNNLDFQPTIILDSIRDVLRDTSMKTRYSLLVLNLGLHYPVSLNFTTYQKLIDDVIQILNVRENELGSNARVIWKTTTSLRKEKTKPPRNATQWRFFTEPRVRLFDTYAMWAMCRAGIEVLDVFPLTASYPNGTKDIVHYSNNVFNAAEIALENYVKAGPAFRSTRVCMK